MRIPLLAALILFAVPGVSVGARAQTAGSACGSLPDAGPRLKRLSRYFLATEYAEFRDRIDPISPIDSHAVVLDEARCGPIMRAVAKYPRAQPSRDELQRNGYDFNVFRYGPYYVVVLDEHRASGAVSAGWMRMLIFSAKDFEFLGIRLV